MDRFNKFEQEQSEMIIPPLIARHYFFKIEYHGSKLSPDYSTLHFNKPKMKT